MNCLFCGSNNLDIKTEKSYERHFGENVFFKYSYIYCEDCLAEFVDDSISTNNANSYLAMMEEVKRKQIKIRYHSTDESSLFLIGSMIAMHSSITSKNKNLEKQIKRQSFVDDYKIYDSEFYSVSSSGLNHLSLAA